MLESVIEIAKEAGAAILNIYQQGDLGVTTKEDDSPLTLADIAAHQIIVDRLKEIYPNLPILSEEAPKQDFEERQFWDSYWLIDPLDGTKEFVKQNGEFTVNIALIQNKVPILGVVYAPVLDICYFSLEGLGSFKQVGHGAPKLIQVQIQGEGNSIKVVASRSHSDEKTVSLLQKLGNCECLSMGSSLKLCLVAEGAAHFYPRFAPTMEWDTAAAHAVVLGAGGVVWDLNRAPLVYNKSNLLNPSFIVLAPSNLDILNSLGDLR
ncbi:3'(2'),5'-bisphosphate nucleotidase CysQ [Serratia sp. T13T92]|uniref:3'(2'),5'-bisphosphate nucleotidase CysQ n=1 Tax=Serratia sp. T13T92 TaxID=3397496 RepID=UPI0039E01EA8